MVFVCAVLEGNSVRYATEKRLCKLRAKLLSFEASWPSHNKEKSRPNHYKISFD